MALGARMAIKNSHGFTLTSTRTRAKPQGVGSIGAREAGFGIIFMIISLPGALHSLFI